jgi:putative oxidoreductase
MSHGELTRLHGCGITVIRVVVGIVFLAHGGQKLFVLGFSAAAGIMVRAGIPAPMLAAVIVTLVEFLGGLALLLGLFTRWCAIPLAIDMAVAILTVHWPNGFFLPKGYEFALTLLAASVALTLLGSGEASLDRLLAQRKAR